jgi:D-aspartate ligase
VIAMGSGVSLCAAIRLLHRADIPAFVVCPDDDFSRYSRWCRILPGAEKLTPENLSSSLENLDLDSAVLLPCGDDWLAATAALPPESAIRFPASIAPSSVIETFTDKWRFAQLLEKERLPYPRTQLLSSDEQLDGVPDSAFQGAILKPLSSVDFSRQYGVKGFLINSRDEARLAMRNVSFPILLQEFIPGPPTAGYFVEGFMDRHGRMCGLFARRRLRMYPVPLGNSMVMESVPLDEVAGAVHMLRYLLEEVSYRGTFSAEFKFDERDGHFKIFEVNARPWWYVEVPASAGINVCRMAYLDALELEVEPVCDYEPGKRFGYLFGDMRAWWRERQTGGPGFWSWLESWREIQSTPFSWHDPLPAIVEGWRQVRGYVRNQSRSRLPEYPTSQPATLDRSMKTNELAARHH